ncbi:MAG TPA: hypothetical protein VF225_04135 [Gaiellaceae bacterium]
MSYPLIVLLAIAMGIQKAAVRQLAVPVSLLTYRASRTSPEWARSATQS